MWGSVSLCVSSPAWHAAGRVHYVGVGSFGSGAAACHLRCTSRHRPCERPVVVPLDRLRRGPGFSGATPDPGDVDSRIARIESPTRRRLPRPRLAARSPSPFGLAGACAARHPARPPRPPRREASAPASFPVDQVRRDRGFAGTTSDPADDDSKLTSTNAATRHRTRRHLARPLARKELGASCLRIA